MPPPLVQQLQLPLSFGLHIRCAGTQCARMRAQPGVAAFIHGPNRHLGVKRRAQLVHQHHVQVALQSLGQDTAHRHRTTRDGQNQRVLAAVAHQPLGQLLRGIGSVLEHRSSFCLKTLWKERYFFSAVWTMKKAAPDDGCGLACVLAN